MKEGICTGIGVVGGVIASLFGGVGCSFDYTDDFHGY